MADHIDKKYEDTLGVIHSNKSQNYRLNAVKNFENGDHRVCNCH